MKVRIAVTPPAAALNENVFPDYLSECENLGFDTIWLSDLPLGPLGDPLISLTYAAAVTKRLKLGANIVPLGRNPMWLAKQLAQLDRLAKGRLLLSFVPGLGQSAERAALGYATGHRGHAIDEIIELMRRWWAGERVTTTGFGVSFDDVAVEPRPLQDPLEIWLGGKGPAALSRVARLADGWLTSAVTPSEAAQARRTIEDEASACGRKIDGEHFGISVPYAREAPAEATLTTLRERRHDRDLTDVVVTGAEPLKALVKAHCDGGLSKFVVRSVDVYAGGSDWRGDLAWLADTLLPLQT